MKNRRSDIDPKVLAQAAKWSKPKLRKKYTYKPKKMTVEKFIKHSKDEKLQRKYAKYIKKGTFKKKQINTDSDKVYNKFESLNNFSNLKSQNIEFAMMKNKDRKQNKLKKLDSLAWESITIPSNDKIFGSVDGIGNECSVGQLQVIDSKKFFENMDINELNIEEYVLDPKDHKHLNIKTLDIHHFNNESNEFLKLLQFSAHKSENKHSNVVPNTHSKNERKKLKKRKTMKQRAEEKRLKALEKRYTDEMLVKSQTEIDKVLLDLLSISSNDIQYQRQLKMQIKQKWKRNRNNNSTEPPLKRRKLNGNKKCEFRHQIEHLHKKQSISQITRSWNGLLANTVTSKQSSNSTELLSQLKAGNTRDMIEICAKNEWRKYLEQCTKVFVVIMFVSQNFEFPKNTMTEYANDIDFVRIDTDKCKDIAREYNIDLSANNVCVVMDIKAKKEIKRLSFDASLDIIRNEINKLCQTQSELHSLLLQGISDLGFTKPTKIQTEVIPIAMQGNNDILISAATGSGKTLSFGIPIINDLLCNYESVNGYLYGLIITPTRELAIQIESHLQSLCKYTHIKCGLIIGGMSLLKQERILSLSPEIIIGTPGRVWKLIKDSSSLHLRDLTQLRYLVCDEADKLLSSSHFQEMNHILSVIKNVWLINDLRKCFPKTANTVENTETKKDKTEKSQNYCSLMDFLEDNGEESDIDDYKDIIIDSDTVTKPVKKVAKTVETPVRELPYRRQTFIVSATLTLESINRQKKTESKIPIFANLATLVPFQENIRIIDQTLRHRTSLNVCQFEIPLDITDKDAMLAYLLQTYGGRTLIFANTIGCVKRVALILKELKVSNNIHSLHSQQQQKQRLKNLDKFVKLSECILICTDVCGRGIDIPSIDNIIHFQCPLSAEDYIHRTGRIGRHQSEESGESSIEGNSFLLVSAEEMRLYNKIILALKKPNGLNKLRINERLLIQIRRQVSIAQRIASLLHSIKKKTRKTSNLQKMADAAGIELDEINCRALNIMKTDNNLRGNGSNVKRKYSRKNKHKSWEYGINGSNSEVEKEIKELRKSLTGVSNVPKSSYLTKTYIK